MSTFCLKTRAFFFYCHQHLTVVRASFLFSSAFSSIVMLGTKQVQTKQVCLLHGLFPFSVDASFLLLFIPSHENFLICLCNANHTPKITYNLYPILNTAYSEKMPVIMMLQNLDRLESKKTSKTENLEIKVLSGKLQSKNSKKTGSFMLHLEHGLANQVNPFHITAVALEAWALNDSCKILNLVAELWYIYKYLDSWLSSPLSSPNKTVCRKNPCINLTRRRAQSTERKTLESLSKLIYFEVKQTFLLEEIKSFKTALNKALSLQPALWQGKINFIWSFLKWINCIRMSRCLSFMSSWCLKFSW